MDTQPFLQYLVHIMEIAFRPMRRTDFPLLQKWLSEPHIDSWWHQPFTLAEVEETYGPRVDGTKPTHMYLILLNENPIGWVQWYRWSDYPDHAAQLRADRNAAGFDLAIGDKNLLGRGLGSAIIDQFLQRYVFIHPDITGVVSDPEETNLRSLRAFQKAGFDTNSVVQVKGESVLRRIAVLKRPS